MKPFLARDWEKRVAVVAATVLIANLGWVTWRHRRAVPPTEPALARLVSAALEFNLPAVTPTDRAPFAWLRPAAAERDGRGTPADLFTPPASDATSSPLATAAIQSADAAEGDEPFGLELVRVEPEPFRLQLAGYYFGPEGLVAAMVGPAGDEPLFGHDGTEFGALGLTLLSLDLNRFAAESGGTQAAPEVAAVAVLWDDVAGGEVVLDSRARQTTGRLRAVVRLAESDTRREIVEGATLSDRTHEYRIDRIELDPPAVVVTRFDPKHADTQRRVLRPAADEARGNRKAEPGFAAGNSAPSLAIRGN